MGKIDISTQRVSNSLRIANSSLTLIYNHPSKALIHKIMILISIRKPNGPYAPTNYPPSLWYSFFACLIYK